MGLLNVQRLRNKAEPSKDVDKEFLEVKRETKEESEADTDPGRRGWPAASNATEKPCKTRTKSWPLGCQHGAMSGGPQGGIPGKC